MDFLKAPYCEISRLVVRLGIDMAAVASACITVGLFGTCVLAEDRGHHYYPNFFGPTVDDLLEVSLFAV